MVRAIITVSIALSPGTFEATNTMLRIIEIKAENRKNNIITAAVRPCNNKRCPAIL
jgi:hypothetical protein